jgi:hypothetical protein
MDKKHIEILKEYMELVDALIRVNLAETLFNEMPMKRVVAPKGCYSVEIKDYARISFLRGRIKQYLDGQEK